MDEVVRKVEDDLEAQSLKMAARIEKVNDEMKKSAKRGVGDEEGFLEEERVRRERLAREHGKVLAKLNQVSE